MLLYYIIINLFGFFLTFLVYFDLLKCYIFKNPAKLEAEYDYIIVGSGSAGSIVAKRLSDNEKNSVLLLEAGSWGSSILDVPSLGLTLQKSAFDWHHVTVPQKNSCLGLDNNASVWPMGKILGGSSMLNNMVYIRGDPNDFSNWFGNQANYNYHQDIEPYFERIEKSLFDSNELPFLSKLSKKIEQSATSNEYQLFKGITTKPGFTIPTAQIHRGRRKMPIHLLLNSHKSNLFIQSNAMVEKVLFASNFEARAVKYYHLGQYYEAKAKKAAIISAGVIGTTKILLLSGIGPQKHLKQLKIAPIIDLPVGENLQDHVTTGLDLVLVDQSSLNIGIPQMMSPLSLFQFYHKSSGPWTTIGCENMGFFKIKNGADNFDLQLMILPVGVSADGGVHLRKLSGISDFSYNNYFNLVSKKTAVTFLPIVLHPKSRGTIRLRSKNLFDQPLIDPNYLSNREDVDIIIDGIEIVKKLIKSEALFEFGTELNPHQYPGCGKFKFDSRDYWECYIRHLTITSYHPVGTCALGTVLNYDFTIKGTNKLYVVDGSVLPTLTSGNVNAAIMMLAAKAVDVIKYHDFILNRVCFAKDIFISSNIC